MTDREMVFMKNAEWIDEMVECFREAHLADIYSVETYIEEDQGIQRHEDLLIQLVNRDIRLRASIYKLHIKLQDIIDGGKCDITNEEATDLMNILYWYAEKFIKWQGEWGMIKYMVRLVGEYAITY